MVNCAAWHCGITGKVTVVEQIDTTKPVTCRVTVGFCQPNKDYDRLMERLHAVAHQVYPIPMSFDQYLDTYKYNHAARLF